jgi:hypothetical protein
MTWYTRQTTEAGMTTVGSELTWSQLDGNFIKAKRLLASLLDAMNIAAYSTATTYQPGTFVRHNMQLWLQIRATSSVNIDPGTDASVWREAAPSELAHVAGTDTKLRTPSGVDVSAVDIKAVVDTGLKVTTVTITSSELRNLNSSPKVVIPAISFKTIVPISCIGTVVGTPAIVYSPSLIGIKSSGSNTFILTNESILDSSVTRSLNFSLVTVDVSSNYTIQYEVGSDIVLYAPISPANGTFSITLSIIYQVL